MTAPGYWYNDRGVRRFHGYFPEPSDEELAAYETPPNSAATTRRVECGTRRGYRLHRKYDERTCQDCRTAVSKAVEKTRVSKAAA